MSRGLLEGRRMKRGGQMVGSNQGRMPVRWCRKRLGMVLDLRGFLEGCCLGYSSLTGLAWLKTGCQANGLQGNQEGRVCGSGSLQGCEGGA